MSPGVGVGFTVLPRFLGRSSNQSGRRRCCRLRRRGMVVTLNCIASLENWKMWTGAWQSLGRCLPILETSVSSKCQKLEASLDKGIIFTSACIKRLTLRGCLKLKLIPYQSHDLTSLEYVNTDFSSKLQADSLSAVAWLRSITNIRMLAIEGYSLQELLEDHDHEYGFHRLWQISTYVTAHIWPPCRRRYTSSLLLDGFSSLAVQDLCVLPWRGTTPDMFVDRGVSSSQAFATKAIRPQIFARVINSELSFD